MIQPAGLVVAPDQIRRFKGRAMASPLELTAVVGGGRDRALADHAWSVVVDEFAAAEARALALPG